MRGILFDKDGTLLDFQASWSPAYRALSLDLCGGDEDAARAMLVAGGMDPESGRFRSGSVLAAGNTIDIVGFWFPHMRGAELDAMIARVDAVFYENGIRYSVPVPGLRKTLDELSRAGLVMGVATSDGTAAARAALDALGFATFLPHVFGYDSVPRPKPAPDIVHAFAAAVGAGPERITVVGDNPHDLEMARSAGAGAAIGVLTGNSTADELAPLADAVLDSVCALPGWLKSRPLAGVR
jgi:phosphoglycolate phosphatase